MPDITMCSTEQCPLKGGCYRSRATPSCWQSYAYFEHTPEGTCEHYWPTHTQQAKIDALPAHNKGETE